KLAVEMSKEGYQVTGLDLSEDMLTMAYDYALKNGENIQFIQGDMRDLEGIGQYDAVTCYSDSLCYMENEEELLKVFKEVRSILREEGTFLFDVHSLHKVKNVFPGYQYHYVTEEAAFLWSSYAGDVENTVEHDLVFFIQDSHQEKYTRYEENHVERTYCIETYQQLLEKAGFKQIEVTSEFGKEKVKEDSERWFFSCKV